MTTQFAKSKPHCIAVRRVATLRQICRNTNAKKSMHVCNIYICKKSYERFLFIIIILCYHVRIKLYISLAQ